MILKLDIERVRTIRLRGSRGWLRTGHGREQYRGQMNHDTVTVRCDRMGIL